jgi:putative holliday junction resolvase
MKMLAIDYGEKRIGLAVAYGEIIETLPEILSVDPELFAKISLTCQQEEIEIILLGISEGSTAIKTKKFAERLSDIVKLPIEFVDETLTTWEAKKVLGQRGKNRPVDSVSAALILKRFIIKKKGGG